MPDIFTPKNPPAESIMQQDNPVIVPHAESHIHSFASFCQNPKNVTFQAQESNEEILLFLRRHFITNVPWIVTSILAALLPFLFSFFIPFFAQASTIPQTFMTVFLLFYYLILFTYIFINFLTWFYNISFVTTKRVVDIDFLDLVSKNVAATKLSLVQDVSYSQVGVIRSLFDYGDVLVQTAGSIDNFDLLAVPQPERVVTIIEEYIGKRPHV